MQKQGKTYEIVQYKRPLQGKIQGIHSRFGRIGKHSVYLVYGEASRGEKREMAPNGHDEILFLLAGDAQLSNRDTEISLEKEQAVYMSPDESFTFTAKSDCKYIVAGTHTTPHGH